MAWVDWKVFTDRWLARAEREHGVLDDGDRFISLWIAFNGWMSGRFGEARRDADNIKYLKEMQDFRDVFNRLRKENLGFRRALDSLEGVPVQDMRFAKNREQVHRYDGTFESLVDVIYRVRCNLFHGKKNIDEDNKDFELVRLSYRILLPLFKEYLYANPS